MDQNAEIWKHCLEHAALSDLGMRRGNNQDAMAVMLADSQEVWLQRGHLFMVADGMGAHAAGELASKMAVDAVTLAYRKISSCPAPEALRRALTEANHQIHDRGQASFDFRGMGTTASILALLPQGAVVAHVGDSRVYRLRGLRFEQLTFDHSLVWEMSQANDISEHDVPECIPRNIITRSLGPNPDVKVDLEGPFPLESGDAFLLCSDGLSGMVSDEEMGAILYCMPPEDAARSLVDLANLRGGLDNITVVAVRVTSPQLAKPSGPPTASQRVPKRPVHSLLWLLLALLALTTLGAAALGATTWAMGALVAAIVTGTVILTRLFGCGDDRYAFGEQPLGRGPHRSFDCTPNGELVGRIADSVAQLREDAARHDWPIDWQRFTQTHDQANEAAAAGRYPQAVRLYCHAMSFAMAHLRDQ